MLDQETKRKIDNARDILVGKVPDPKSQIEQITIALIYKFMDDMDKEAQELGGKSKFFNNGYEKYSWTALMDSKLGGIERLNLYAEAMIKMAENPNIPQLFRDVFKGAFLPYRSPETLSLFLKEINGFKYTHSEDLGDAYEYLLSVMSSQGDAGQFRTPRHIIDFIVEVVDPKKDESILDPACGTAGFLISAFKHIIKNNKDKPLNPEEKKRLMDSIVGYDISPDMVKLSKVNLYLHGFPTPHIFEYDTLSYEEKWEETYDVIMANPPFMTPKGGIKPHKRFSIQANRAEVLFVDYIMEHLNINGRAGIIVPEGIIFQSAKAYKNLRKMLIEENYLWAVVSLPAGVFQPYSGVKTSILFLDRQLAKKTDSILFVKVENDGFDLGAQRRPIDKNDLPEALEILKKYQSNLTASEKTNIQSLKVEKKKIAQDGDYNLTGDRYRVVDEQKNQNWPMVELGELEKQNKIKFLRGQGISKKDIIENGKNYCIHYGEIYTLYQKAVIKNVISKTNYEGKIFSEEGDVLVPATTTADAYGIAVARSLNIKGVILGGDINIIRTKNKFILSDYLSYLINYSNVRNQLASFAKGANILHLSNNDLRKLKIPLPPLEVQKEIVEEIEVKEKAIESAKEVIKNLERERQYFGKKVSKIKEVEWVELKELIEHVKYTKKIKRSDFKQYGNYPVIDQSQNFIAGYWNQKEDVFCIKKPVIIFGDHTRIIKYVNFNFVIGADGIKILKTNDRIIPKFLYFILLGIKIKNLGYSRHFKLLNNIKIPLPPLEVQKQLVQEMEEQEKIIEANKKLIEIMEEKIKEVISEI